MKQILLSVVDEKTAINIIQHEDKYFHIATNIKYIININIGSFLSAIYSMNIDIDILL